MANYFNYIQPDQYLQLNNGDVLAGDIIVDKLIVPSNCTVIVRPYWEIINNAGVFHNTTNDPGGYVNIKANEIIIDGTIDASGSGYPGGGGGEGGCGADDRENKSPNHNGSGVGIGGQNGTYSNFDVVRGSFESAAGGNGGKGMSKNGFDINGGMGGARTSKYGQGKAGGNGDDGIGYINDELNINCYMGSGGGGGGGASGGGGNQADHKCGGGGGGGGGGGNGGGIIRIFAFKKFLLSLSGKIVSNGGSGYDGENGYHGGVISSNTSMPGYSGRIILNCYGTNKNFFETAFRNTQIKYFNWDNKIYPYESMGPGGRGGYAGNSNKNGVGGSYGLMENYEVYNPGLSGAGGVGGMGGGGAGGAIILCLGLDYNLNENKFKGSWRGHKIIKRFIVNGSLSCLGKKNDTSNKTKYLTNINGGTIKVFYINENRDFNYSKSNCKLFIEKEFNNIVLI